MADAAVAVVAREGGRQVALEQQEGEHWSLLNLFMNLTISYELKL